MQRDTDKIFIRATTAYGTRSENIISGVTPREAFAAIMSGTVGAYTEQDRAAIARTVTRTPTGYSFVDTDGMIVWIGKARPEETANLRWEDCIKGGL